MPASTLQSQTVGVLNGLLAAAIEIVDAINKINQLSTQYTQLTMGGVANKFGTVALNTDGSLGSTPDVTPVPANPINAPLLQTASGVLLNRALSANDYASLLTSLQGFASLATGAAVAANGATPQLLAKVTGS